MGPGGEHPVEAGVPGENGGRRRLGAGDAQSFVLLGVGEDERVSDGHAPRQKPLRREPEDGHGHCPRPRPGVRCPVSGVASLLV